MFITEELRKLLEQQRERMAECVFRTMLEKGKLRFLIISDDLKWTFPPDIKIEPGSRRLAQKNNTPLKRSLFDQVPEDDFNETEKAVAWYLEGQEQLFFWFRNRARIDYAIQGWRQHRIFPDFIFTAATDDAADDYTWVYVVETKGMHLKDNERTQYTRRLFDICTEKAQSRKWNEFGHEMKDKVLRFEVLTEVEWKAKLNELLQS